MLKTLAISAAATALAAALAAAIPGAKPGPDPASPAPGGGPVLVELYQSQGCSSCPPANANLNAIADRPDVVALSFAVTYWDYLGWKDTFAAPEFTDRQWDYARRNGRGNVATPQMWVNGRTTIVGYDPRQLAATIAAARTNGPQLAIGNGEVRVGAGRPHASGDVWLARYDPRTIQVPIRRGENEGRTLPHKNVVRQLVRLGHWDGRASSFALPAGRPGLADAVFLQAGKGGVILAAAKRS